MKKGVNAITDRKATTDRRTNSIIAKATNFRTKYNIQVVHNIIDTQYDPVMEQLNFENFAEGSPRYMHYAVSFQRCIFSQACNGSAK